MSNEIGKIEPWLIVIWIGYQTRKSQDISIFLVSLSMNFGGLGTRWCSTETHKSKNNT